MGQWKTSNEPRLVFLVLMTNNAINAQQVKQVAQLANLPLADEEVAKLEAAFDETLPVISNLQKLDTSSVEPTHQVTGLENVLREDIVDTSRMFSQVQALANAPKKHEGFFVVPQIIDQD